MLNENINYEYNDVLDVLYITLETSDDSYGHEDDYGIVLNYDFCTKKLVGVDIWDFKKKIKDNKEIPLPLEIDLKNIYSSLLN